MLRPECAAPATTLSGNVLRCYAPAITSIILVGPEDLMAVVAKSQRLATRCVQSTNTASLCAPEEECHSRDEQHKMVTQVYVKQRRIVMFVHSTFAFVPAVIEESRQPCHHQPMPRFKGVSHPRTLSDAQKKTSDSI